MKTPLKAAVMALVVAGLSIAVAPRAHATPVYTDELELISSGTTMIVTGTGVTSFSGSVGSFSINITTGITYPTQGSLASPIMDLSSVNVSGGTGTLEILFSATGFGPTTGHFLDEIGGTVNNAGGSITYDAYDSPSDALLAETNTVAALGPYGSGAFSGTALSSFVSLASAYSLTQMVTITHSTGGTSSFDANLSVVPDGGWTVALLGIALGGIEMLRRKMMGARNEMVA